ncbi:hypothetical protein CHS0354_014680 [Potamilus streckersoni]|uniref:C-type lectin domain-containing protein n=1 Tax=Potamilus streckersoni TaxID=2493646 RepID=A0AAE0SPX1_9BIVA|nr:hypothetical protein CHS0354_014680 [Potamilus streckersoni]
MGCEQWTRGGRKCYHFYNEPKLTWVNARTKCQSLGGDLLKVENKDEKWWITGQMLLTTDSYWTGLNDRAQEGTYVWADAATSQDQLVMWNQEPNDYMGQEDCGIIFSNGGYNDANCAAKAAFICELQYQGTTCPAGWVSRTTTQMLDCYFISDYKNTTMIMTWSEALGYCASQAPSQSAVSLLLSVDDANEKAFIEQQLSTLDRNFGGWWTGLNDKDREGYWSFYGQAVIASTLLM